MNIRDFWAPGGAGGGWKRSEPAGDVMQAVLSIGVWEHSWVKAGKLSRGSQETGVMTWKLAS